MAAPSPATFRSAPPPSYSVPPPSPAASVSSPSDPPASAPSPSPVQAENTEWPAVSPNSNSLSITPQPPPPPLLAPSPSITPAAAPPLPPPPTSILNSLKISPRPVLSPYNPPSRPPSAPPTGDAPPPLLLPLPPPPSAVKAPKSSPQAKTKPPSSSSSPPLVVSANAGDAPTEIHNLSHPSPTAVAGTGSKHSSRFSAGGVTGIGIGVGLFILLSFVCVVVWCKCRRRRKISGFGNSSIRISFSLQPDPPTSDASVMKIHSSAPLIGTSSSRTNSLYSPRFSPDEHLRFSGPRFTFEELGNATNWFSPENLLAKHALQENSGSCVTSHVYKGYLPNGREIAVKHHPVQPGAIRGFESEFKAELEIISRVHHRHLVSLVGYCITDDSKFLVYDYIPNNTLYFHLHGEGAAVLDWAKRVRIAVGAARGIAYLHEDCCPRIIHRDIKSSNILLDNNYEPWLSDFGLAKLAFDANPHIATRVMATFGYMAPEYALSGELTEKSDVYSFGVVLLELITGQKPVDISVSLRDEGLVEWARPLLNRTIENEEFHGLIDPGLDNNYVKSEMLRMIEAAAACLHDSAAERPRMGQVVKILSNVAQSDLMNGTGLGESEVLNVDERSREIEAFRRMQLRSHGYSTEYFSL